MRTYTTWEFEFKYKGEQILMINAGGNEFTNFNYVLGIDQRTIRSPPRFI
jgi:hypothetical protein